MLYIEDGFNPQLVDSLNACGKSFTPVSINLKSGMTVITGANMGGKSVTLKTVVLNLMLLHAGFYVCAKEACLPVLDFIELISDDLQSVSQGLSTFGAEIMRLREMLALAGKGTGFMGFDEFARGTNPNEGCYMAKALCACLNKLPSISLLTTHYDGVADDTMTHYQVIGLENADFIGLKEKINLKYTNSIDIIQSCMDYRLKRVTSNTQVPRDALNISMLMGLDDEIITIAKNLYEKGDCDNYGK
jgi:dsDNA-specific endonuclease/ATPase MutS2